MAQEKEGAVGWEARGKRREDVILKEASAPGEGSQGREGPREGARGGEVGTNTYTKGR